MIITAKFDDLPIILTKFHPFRTTSLVLNPVVDLSLKNTYAKCTIPHLRN